MLDVADRVDADPRADPVGAERDHRHGALAAPDVDRRPVPALLPAHQLARRPRPLDDLQRRLLDRRRVHGRRGRDLHVLERRLPRLVHPGADRLLPAAQAPAERAAAVQAARVDEVRRARASPACTRSSTSTADRCTRTARATRPDERRCRTTSSGSSSCSRTYPLYCVPQARRGQATPAGPAGRPRRRTRRSPARRTRERDGPGGAGSAGLADGPVRADSARDGRAADPGSRDRARGRARRALTGASVRVFSIARVHGVSFGMPNPGLLPNQATSGPSSARSSRRRSSGSSARASRPTATSSAPASRRSGSARRRRSRSARRS